MKKAKISALAVALTFVVGAFFGCNKEKNKELTVYLPDGAPALALAGMMANDTENDGVAYRVVSPSVIATKVTNTADEKNADVCVMPITAASKLLGNGESYQMLGAVTHGNLYMVAKNAETVYTLETLSLLVGQTVGVLQINEVPGLTFKAVLNKYGISWQEVSEGQEKSADKVNLVAITGAEAVGVVQADCFVLAEPAASVQRQKGYTIVGDMQALYGGENGYTQAVAVAKTSLTADGAWAEEFTEKLKTSIEWLKTADGAQIVSAVSAHMEDKGVATSLKAPLLSAEVVARCGVRFAKATECKTTTEEFLRALLAVNDKSAAIPNEAFYYTAE